MHKIDLHNHGAIGFHPKWQRLQGYSTKNILRLWADQCFKTGINICAVTSESDAPAISINHYEDRINYLLHRYAKDLPAGYSVGKLGDNSFAVKKGGQRVVFLSGQTVVVRDKDLEGNTQRFDHLVIGSNQVENGRSWEYTLKSARDKGLIQIAEHPTLLTHFGQGPKALERNIDYFDAIEGYNAQLSIPRVLSKLPMLKNYSRRLNDEAIILAKNCRKPFIACSDAHQIKDTGLAYIATSDEIREDLEENLISDIKKTLKRDSFACGIEYPRFLNWLNWSARFKLGLILHFNGSEKPAGQ